MSRRRTSREDRDLVACDRRRCRFMALIVALSVVQTQRRRRPIPKWWPVRRRWSATISTLFLQRSLPSDVQSWRSPTARSWPGTNSPQQHVIRWSPAGLRHPAEARRPARGTTASARTSRPDRALRERRVRRVTPSALGGGQALCRATPEQREIADRLAPPHRH
jgi:hypothetical protein